MVQETEIICHESMDVYDLAQKILLMQNNSGEQVNVDGDGLMLDEMMADRKPKMQAPNYSGLANFGQGF